MKNRLLLLSDMWGGENPEWISIYRRSLSAGFETVYYDLRKIAGIPASVRTADALHHAYLDTGIKAAVDFLVENEAGTRCILAFSMGGTIAWRFAQRRGLPVILSAVSATRLRYEQTAPTGKLKLYFGEEDPYQPDDSWVKRMGAEVHTFPNAGHDLYRDAGFSDTIISDFRRMADFSPFSLRG